MIRRLMLYSFKSGGTMIDADTKTYLEAAGVVNSSSILYFASTDQEITGREIYLAFNDFVTTAKTVGWWSKMAAMYPFVLDTADSHKWNLKDPRDLDVAYRLGFAGLLTHSALGVVNESDGYADTFFSPLSVIGTNQPFAYGINIATNVDEGAQDMGSYDGTFECIDTQDTSSTHIFSLGASFQTPTDEEEVFTGFYQVVTNSSKISVLKDGVEVASKNAPFSGNHSNRSMYLMALNFDGPAAVNSHKRIDFAYLSNGELTFDEAASLDTSVKSLTFALKREIVGAKTSVFFGDSITVGTGASTDTQKWVSLYSAAKGTFVHNKGIVSTALQNSTPVNPAGIGPNMRDRASSDIPLYSPFYDRLFISYGTNDVGFNLTNYTVPAFKTQLIEVINIAIGKGWPLENIIIQSPVYYNQTGRDLYVTSGYGVTIAADLTRHLAHVMATGEACEETGVVFANTYDYMSANGADTLLRPDGLHPNDTGHSLIAEYMVKL